MLVITVEDAPVQHALNRINWIVSQAGMAEMLRVGVVPYLQNQVRQRFATESDRATGPWQPLSEATVAAREDLGFPGEHPINVRTGQMKMWASESMGQWSFGPESVELEYPGHISGAIEEKFIAAQMGGTSDFGNMFPARPIVSLDTADVASLLSIMQGWLVLSMRGGGTLTLE